MVFKISKILVLTAMLASTSHLSWAQDAAFDYNALSAEQKAAMVAEGKTLIKGWDCLTCHRIKTKLTGPAYQEVATKYAAQRGTGIIDQLANKVIKGGNGVWGFAMMTPHPQLKLEDVRKAIMGILSIADKTAPAADAAKKN